MNNRLYKYEKLCSLTAVNDLFAHGKGAVAYPLRAVVAVKPRGDEPAAARFMITVPKKKIRTAVDRVYIRRRIREAYRLNRSLLFPRLEAIGCRVEIAFIYMDKEWATYDTIEGCMKSLMEKIAAYAEKSLAKPAGGNGDN